MISGCYYLNIWLLLAQVPTLLGAPLIHSANLPRVIFRRPPCISIAQPTASEVSANPLPAEPVMVTTSVPETFTN